MSIPWEETVLEPPLDFSGFYRMMLFDRASGRKMDSKKKEF